MELSSFSEAQVAHVTQKLTSILWNLKFHYHDHKIPPLVSVLSNINPVYITPSYLSKIHFNIILLRISRFF
jgi:hypothetical protein